ncbi:hypothetical protein GCM10027291_19560 [Telluribacter humicola]
MKQVLKDFESAFSLHVNPNVMSWDEKTDALNRMWANVRLDARFENDLVPNNKGSRIIDFKEYQQIASVSYKSGRGLNYSLEWDEAEFKQAQDGYMVIFYGLKTLLGTYQGRVPLRIEGEPCRAVVFLRMQGSTIHEAKIGLMDTDLRERGKPFSLHESVNPLDFFTLLEAIDKLATQVAQQIPENVVKKISIETFTYQGKKVVNEFSHQITGTLKSSLTQHNPDIEIAVITRSAAFEPYMTLRGHYQKVGNFLKIHAQLYNYGSQPVGKAIESEVLLINLPNAAIEPPIALVEEATRIHVEIDDKPEVGPVPVKAGDLRLELSTNKGMGPQSYTEDDTMRVSVRVNTPCTVRLIYRDAANNLVLLRNQDFRIAESEVDRWVKIPTDFVCAAPFGVELLLGFATTGQFEPLHTEELSGYTIIKDDLKKVKVASSADQKRKKAGVGVAERSIQITTQAKSNHTKR